MGVPRVTQRTANGLTKDNSNYYGPGRDKLAETDFFK